MFAACCQLCNPVLNIDLCDFEVKITFDLILGYTLLIFGDL